MILDAALVGELIAAQFPAWADLPVTPVPHSGSDNRTFRLGPELIVRLPSSDAHAAMVEKEQRWLPHLRPGLPLPIPEPVARGAPSAAFPRPWSVYLWIEGRAVSSATPDDPLAFAEDLADFLRALQRIDARGGPAPGAHSFQRGGDLRYYEGEARAAIRSLGNALDPLAPDAAAGAHAVLDAALASRWTRAPVWVHGDVAAGNLLLRDGVLAGVIDFGCCAVGDPACDLVIAWTLLDPEARRRFRARLALDDDCWARARGWALWKALITLAARPDPAAGRVVTAVLAEQRAEAG